MKKNKKIYSCNNCGAVTNKWTGQCLDCEQWGSLFEEFIPLKNISSIPDGNIQMLDNFINNNLDIEDYVKIPTSINELNRVLGGGFVIGSTVLIGGDPGIGKSTLLLQLVANLANDNIGCLYITGEESLDQIKLRAKRLKVNNNKALLLSSTNLEDIIVTVEANKRHLKLIVIDSIQTITSSIISSLQGTVSQIKTSANTLINYIKQNKLILLIACHVNKEGQIAGPKLLEHMVDTVLYFEGDYYNHFRILRAIKNRYGSINEIGVFEMVSTGLIEVKNPSEILLMDRANNISGSAIFATMEGSRSVLVEVQALVAPTNMPTPRRALVGWDANRLSMIIAILAVRLGLNLTNYEVYLSIAGGLKITEPAADFAVAAALISSALNIPLAKNSIYFGEVGLSGEVRKVSNTEIRLKEAIKLGFKQIYCHSTFDFNGCVHQISHLSQFKEIIHYNKP